MCNQLHRERILTAQAINDLHSSKQQILDATAGKLPERLVRSTAAAAARLARREASPADVLSQRVLLLVGTSLKAMARRQWKPDTALWLRARRAGLREHPEA